MPTTNTGKKIYNTLTQVLVDTGVPTGITKENDPDDPDYILPIEDDTACPPPTPPVVLINKLQISLVNDTTQSINLVNFSLRPQSSTDPANAYYVDASFGILPGETTTLLAVNQTDDLGHIFFGVTNLSKGIRTHLSIVYKQSTDTIGNSVLDVDIVRLSTIDQQFSTLRIDNSSDTNTVRIIFTENPLPSPPTQDPPVVEAGNAQTIPLPTTTATLSATVSTSGTIPTVSWIQVSGPTTVALGTPNGITTSINGLTNIGVYTFQFTATDNLGQSTSDTVTITITANPNGIVNMLVDPGMANNTFQITQVTLYDIVTPSNAPIDLLTTTLDKTSGVTVKTPPKSTYRIVVTVVGATAGSKSLIIQWGSNTISFVLPQAGVYAIDNVIVDEGGNGVLLTYKASVVASPTFAIAFAKLTVDSPITDSQNTLPNGLIVTQRGNVTVAFFSDNTGTTPTNFTGNVINQTVTTDNIETTSITAFGSTGVSAANSVILSTIQEYQVYDYTQTPNLRQDTSYAYTLQPGQGYLIIP